MKKITKEELKQKIDNKENFYLVETLAPESFEQWHLPGAINIPKSTIEEQAPKIIRERDADVVVYCANPKCTSSTISAEKLEDMGYTNVYEYEGGKSDWEAAGFPKEQ